MLKVCTGCTPPFKCEVKTVGLLVFLKKIIILLFIKYALNIKAHLLEYKIAVPLHFQFIKDKMYHGFWEKY